MNKGFPKCPTKRKDIEPSTAESSLKRSKRGDPICSIEDVNVKDIGLHYQKSATLTDAERYDLLKNHWKPDKSFEFPCSQEGSSKRKFNFNLLTRFPWLAYSKFVDGCFCVPCLLFGMRSGHNSGKLSKLFTEPLTLWTSAASKL